MRLEHQEGLDWSGELLHRVGLLVLSYLVVELVLDLSHAVEVSFDKELASLHQVANDVSVVVCKEAVDDVHFGICLLLYLL